MSQGAGRAAIVTGGSAGIGLAIARLLAEEGHGVTIAARDGRRAQAVAASLRAHGAQAEAEIADIASDDDVARLVSAHRKRFGRLDVLINNAGYGGPLGSVEALDQRVVDRVFAVNLRGTYLVSRACLPLLRAAGGEHGRALVVNTASVAAVRGIGEIAAYSATKAAIVRLGEALQAELAGTGVKVTSLCPALTATPMSEKAWARAIPLADMLRPEDLAEVVRFLLRTSPACTVPEVVLMRPGLRV